MKTAEAAAPAASEQERRAGDYISFLHRFTPE